MFFNYIFINHFFWDRILFKKIRKLFGPEIYQLRKKSLIWYYKAINYKIN